MEAGLHAPATAGQPLDEVAGMDSQEEPDSLDSTALLQQGEVSPSPGAAPAPAAAEGDVGRRRCFVEQASDVACHFVLKQDCPDRHSQP